MVLNKRSNFQQKIPTNPNPSQVGTPHSSIKKYEVLQNLEEEDMKNEKETIHLENIKEAKEEKTTDLNNSNMLNSGFNPSPIDLSMNAQ